MPQNDSSFQINKRSLLTAVIIIFALIVISYCLTLFLAPGEYDTVIDADGNETLLADSYKVTGEAGQYPGITSCCRYSNRSRRAAILT